MNDPVEGVIEGSQTFGVRNPALDAARLELVRSISGSYDDSLSISARLLEIPV